MSVSEKRTELYVGLFVFFGLAIMAVLILQFGRFEDRFRGKYAIQVAFDDATGLFDDVAIKLGGVKVGTVSGRPRPNPSLKGVIVDLEIYDEFKIPANAQFSIRTSGLMGDNYVGIQIPDAAEGGFIEPGQLVNGQRGGDLQALTLTAEELSVKAKELLTDVTETVRDIRVGVENLNNALSKFDNDILGDENIENVKRSLANLRQTSNNLNEASTRLSPLLDQANVAVTNAGETFEGTQELVERLGPLIADFETAAEGATQTINNVNRGNGLLTALLTDPALKEDFVALVANLRDHGILRYKESTKIGGSAPKKAPSPSRSSSDKRKPFFRK